MKDAGKNAEMNLTWWHWAAPITLPANWKKRHAYLKTILLQRRYGYARPAGSGMLIPDWYAELRTAVQKYLLIPAWWYHQLQTVSDVY
jgi:hypothetical protein